MQTLDAYIRVSQVGDREGESYRTVEQQRAAIEAWAAANGVRIGVTEKDENVKGDKAVKDRALGRLVARAEEGRSDGIVTFRLNRFGRRMSETVTAITALKDAGKRFVSVSPDSFYDTAQPGGQVMLGVLAGLAEQQLEERRENWRASQTEAVAEGKHVGKAPIGYVRRDRVHPEYDAKGKLIKDARLLVDEQYRAVVHEAFEMRARGASLGKVAAFVNARAGRRMSRANVKAMVENRVYLGEARGSHGAVNRSAHEAIVDEVLFAAAQKEGRYTPKDGSLSRQALLAGIITCTGCGKRLHLNGRGRKGERRTFYVCTERYAGRECPAPAIGEAARIDEHVLFLLSQDEGGAIDGAGTADADFLRAREAVAAAESELERFADPTLSTDLGEDLWRRGIAQARANLEAARAELWELEDPGLPDDAEVLQVGGRQFVVWGEDVEADRRLLKRIIGTCTLAKADHRRRWQPIEERVTLRWKDGREPVIPSVAELVAQSKR